MEEEAWRGAEPLAVEDSQLAEEALESAEPSPPPVPAEATVVVEEAALLPQRLHLHPHFPCPIKALTLQKILLGPFLFSRPVRYLILLLLL